MLRSGESLRRLPLARAKLLVCGALALQCASSCFAADGTGLHKQVVFGHYPALTTNAELIERLFRPMLARRLREELAGTGQKADAQDIDLAREHFALYVPASVPASGKYGLLVWISPFDDAAFPSSWLPVLDKHGMICVSAGGSGNTANVYSRRIPLALLGYTNVTQV